MRSVNGRDRREFRRVRSQRGKEEIGAKRRRVKAEVGGGFGRPEHGPSS